MDASFNVQLTWIVAGFGHQEKEESAERGARRSRLVEPFLCIDWRHGRSGKHGWLLPFLTSHFPWLSVTWSDIMVCLYDLCKFIFYPKIRIDWLMLLLLFWFETLTQMKRGFGMVQVALSSKNIIAFCAWKVIAIWIDDLTLPVIPSFTVTCAALR